MDTLYSLSLLVSLLGGGASILCGLAAHFSLKSSVASAELPLTASKPLRFTKAALCLAGLAGIAGLTSAVVHWLLGHGARSAEPMAVGDFVRAHPAFIWAGALLSIGAVVASAARVTIGSHVR